MPPILKSFDIVVYGTPYDVVAGLVKVPNGGLKPKLYTQHAPKKNGEYVCETPIDMQKRIEEDIVDIQAERVRSARLYLRAIACMLTCCCVAWAGESESRRGGGEP